VITLERHELGPRVRVLGRRIHEWQLGAAILATVAGLRLTGVVEDVGTALLTALGV